MLNKNVDWPLLVRAGGAPLELARKRIFSAGWDVLDDGAERFLAGIEGLECSDLISWLARRRPADTPLPDGAPTNAQLVDRFARLWEPFDGLNVTRDREGALSLWGDPLARVDTETWDDLVERILPRLSELSGFMLERDQRMMAMCSLHGGEVFAKVCALRWAPITPREVHPTIEPHGHPVDESIEALVTVRRDDLACTRVLIERARAAAATEGGLVPLWVLARVGLLSRVEDPTTVLPARVEFGLVHRGPFTTEELRATPWSAYPEDLALAWPESGRADALRWLTERVLDALDSDHHAALMADRLFGPRLPTSRLIEFGGAHPRTAAYAPWLADRARFDDLMRRSITRGGALPLAWVTVVRDLAAGHTEGWSLARRWLAQTPLHLVVNDRGHMHVDDATWDTARWPDLASLGVDSALSARRWITYAAPLPDDVDDALTEFVEGLHRDFEARADLLVIDQAKGVIGRMADTPEASRWARLWQLPNKSNRRAALFDALRRRPWMLADERIAPVIAQVAPASEEELPTLEDLVRCSTFSSETEPLKRGLAMYLTLGADTARRRLLEFLRANLQGTLRYEHLALPLLTACAPFVDDELRSRVHAAVAGWHFTRIAPLGLQVAATLGVTVDLAAVARARVSQPACDFSKLPEDVGLTEVILARIAWLSREGVDGWTRALAAEGIAQERVSSDHHEIVDGEVILLLERLERQGIDRERLLPMLTARARHGHPPYATRYFALLERAGLRRAELIDLAAERFANVDEHAHSSHADRLLSEKVAPLPEWLGARMASRSAWDADGARLIDRLLDTRGWTLRRVCGAALATKAAAPGDALTLLDAMLMAFAEAFAARAKGGLCQGDHATAHRALRAIMDLDAPSRAYRFLGGLRKLTAGNEQLAAAVEACEHLLRRDTDRAPTADNLWRAVHTFSPASA